MILSKFATTLFISNIRLVAFSILLLCALSQTACNLYTGNSSPEQLAEQCCRCFEEMRSYQNEKKRSAKLDECVRLVRRNLAKLENMGVYNDWSREQVNDAQKRFDAIYLNCN